MIAVDTNLLVRLLTNDAPAQAKKAARLFREHEVLLSKTVLLETEWVLRHAYGLDSTQVVTAFQMLMGLPRVAVEDPTVVSGALAWHAQGLDFADALHLSTSAREGAERFATFDRALAKGAADIQTPAVFVP